MGYRVTAACVVAKVQSETGEGYFYRHAVLPDGVPEEEAKRLEDLGMVEKFDDAPADDADQADADGDQADVKGDSGSDQKSTAQPAAKKTAASPKS